MGGGPRRASQQPFNKGVPIWLVLELFLLI